MDQYVLTSTYFTNIQKHLRNEKYAFLLPLVRKEV